MPEETPAQGVGGRSDRAEGGDGPAPAAASAPRAAEASTSGAAQSAVAVVGLVASVGLIASAVSLLLGGFGGPDRRWAAIAGLVLGAVAVVATWLLALRLQRAARARIALPLEARLFVEEMRLAVEAERPLPDEWRDRATRLYGRLQEAGLGADAEELAVWGGRALYRASRRTR